ncbi:MAG: hypothetical protein L0956_10740 [Candidatus Mariimomonas ferrooxydans]
MPEMKSRQNNPVPGIDYSEICIRDEHNLGTGTFTTVLEPGAMAKISPIISTIVNEPVFKLMINIHLAANEIIALLGKADNSPALSHKIFKLPENINLTDIHSFEVIFKDWEITAMTIDGKSLKAGRSS